MSGTKRIIDFPTGAAYDGYLLQDKSGGVTQKVARGTVAAGLKAEGLAWSPDLADQVDPAKGAGLVGYSDAVVYTSLMGLAVRELRVGADAALRVSGGTITGNLVVNGTLRANGGLLDGAGVTRVSATGAVVGSQVTVSDIAVDQIVTTLAGGRLTGNPGLKVDRSFGVPTGMIIGDGATANSLSMRVNRASSADFSGFVWQTAGIYRWDMSTRSGTDDLAIWARTAAGVSIDAPISMGNAAAAPVVIGGSTLRPTNCTGPIQRNGTQVVNTRRTGWALATGTPTRTTFATSTVTLPQLAERVKALIDDLHATAGHGLIGT